MISGNPFSTISGEDSTPECSRADAGLVYAVLGGGFGGPFAYFGTAATTYFGVNPLSSIGVAAVNGVSCPKTAILCFAGSITCALCGAFVGCCCKDAIIEGITCDYPKPSVNEPQNAPVAPVAQVMGQITREERV